MTDLKPGPELDALVAEKVMGWHENGCLNERHEVERYWCCDSTASWMRPLSWAPSTRIQDAWEVVERLQAQGKDILLQSPQEGDPEIYWLVAIGEGQVELPSKAPHAICLAALMAVQAKAPEAP